MSVGFLPQNGNKICNYQKKKKNLYAAFVNSENAFSRVQRSFVTCSRHTYQKELFCLQEAQCMCRQMPLLTIQLHPQHILAHGEHALHGGTGGDGSEICDEHLSWTWEKCLVMYSFYSFIRFLSILCKNIVTFLFVLHSRQHCPILSCQT